MDVKVKDPNAVLDYVWDWSDWLAGDTITSHEIIDDGNVTVDSSSDTATAVTVWLSGGTVGKDAYVTCRVTTIGGRVDDRTMVFRIIDR